MTPMNIRRLRYLPTTFGKRSAKLSRITISSWSSRRLFPRASYTQYRTLQPLYLDTEMQVAREFHSPDVYVFNVFGLMKAYLRAHDQTYVPYMADGWHPNARGHKLAGELLLMDMLRHFGTQAIPLVPEHAGGAS